MGRTATVSALSPTILTALSACSNIKPKPPIQALKPTFEDNLVLAQGLNYNIIAKWGDPINSKGETFGCDNDFNCFLPFKDNPNEGLLWVNHESVIPQLVHQKSRKHLTRSKEEIAIEQKLVGGSILHIRKDNNQWSLVKNSKYNRRLDGQTKIPFSQNHKILNQKFAIGTIANCSGGVTPWNTFLTSEENYDNFYGEIDYTNKKRKFIPSDKHRWHDQFSYPPEHYGWIVEIDPWTGKAKKQIALGRAPHEGAAVVVTKTSKSVVYMGEDRPGGYIYKFVSTGMHFNEGTLYAADTKKGQWLALDWNQQPKLKKHFNNQLEVLTYSHKAAELLGATPQDRPEDIERDPITGHIFVALTNNPKKNNIYGSILKIKETNDYDCVQFSSETWMHGGLEMGFACPDNFCFDKNGHLWMTVDMSEKEIGKPHYKAFGNNGLFFIPTHGSHAGQAIQVASAPVDAELTGPWLSPDQKTLFLSVQHPGARTKNDLKNPTSHWPGGPGTQARSSVVAIQGPLMDELARL